jgi:hypothetical protein
MRRATGGLVSFCGPLGRCDGIQIGTKMDKFSLSPEEYGAGDTFTTLQANLSKIHLLSVRKSERERRLCEVSGALAFRRRLRPAPAPNARGRERDSQRRSARGPTHCGQAVARPARLHGPRSDTSAKAGPYAVAARAPSASYPPRRWREKAEDGAAPCRLPYLRRDRTQLEKSFSGARPATRLQEQWKAFKVSRQFIAADGEWCFTAIELRISKRIGPYERD